MDEPPMNIKISQNLFFLLSRATVNSIKYASALKTLLVCTLIHFIHTGVGGNDGDVSGWMDGGRLWVVE